MALIAAATKLVLGDDSDFLEMYDEVNLNFI